MKKTNVAITLENGTIDNAHDIEIVCRNCGYDLDEAELAAARCSDCGHKLRLKQNVKITVTSIPLFGGTM